jgi:restriction endonuclease S subunit
VPLGELATIIAGQSPPGSTYRREPVGLPFFQGKADFGPRHPVARVWCTEPNKLAKPGDVLMSIRAPVGPTNVANIECCIGRGLAAIRCGPRLNLDYLLQFLRCIEADIAEQGSGSTFDAINRDQLEALSIPLPPLVEQEKIAGRLTEQLAAAERAHEAAQSRLAAAEALPAAYLREVFEGPETSGWETVRLGETCDLLPSKSISTEGDAVVRAITTACLSERGFLPPGVKTGRMRGSDVADCLVRRGEVLIARSNTPELVGRVAMYDGDPPGVVATDLTIRIWPRENLHADYLTAFLSYLFQTGYWKAKAGGASGTMKKITREQLLAQELRVPPGCTSGDSVRSLSDQRRIAADLAARVAGAERLAQGIRAELAAIEALPAALLREAFGGPHGA